MNTINFKLSGLRFFLFISVLLTGECATAQTFRNFAQKHQFGIECTFGIKSYTMSSNIDALNHLMVIAEGGSIGMSVGSDLLKTKVRQGYYYSASNVGKTIDQVRSALSLNFYPLQLFSIKGSSLRPYLTSGVERNILKMYGFYGGLQESSQLNYSMSEAPYLGKIVTVQVNMGSGLEYNIVKPGYYVSIFAEVKYSNALSTLSATKMFDTTTTGSQLSMNIGIAFGYHK